MPNNTSWMPWLVPGAIILIFVAMYLLLRRGNIMIQTSTETSISEYRSSIVAHIVALVQYWLADILMEEPKIYNDDYDMVTFMDWSSECGTMKIQIDWRRNLVRMCYNFYDRDGEQYATVAGKGHIWHNNTPDKRIIKFLQAVINTEYELLKPYHELLVDLHNNAGVLAMQAPEDMDENTLWASVLSLSTSAIVGRKPSPAQARAYVLMVAALRKHHPEVFPLLQKFIFASKTLERMQAQSSEE